MMILSIDCNSWYCAERLYSIYEEEGLPISKCKRLSEYSIAKILLIFVLDNILQKFDENMRVRLLKTTSFRDTRSSNQTTMLIP